MQWLEVDTDKWMPFDLINNSIHYCESKKSNPHTKDYVLEELQNLGFEAYYPRTVSWKFAFIASNKSQSLYFLIGKRGIDFKFYDCLKETKVDERGRLYTDGGVMVRNYYKDSEVNIHKLILEIASRFITNSPIDECLLINHGTPWKEQKAKYIKSLPKSASKEARDEMIEIYRGISCGDGEDAYLGDGIWISADGSLDDRGH